MSTACGADFAYLYRSKRRMAFRDGGGGDNLSFDGVAVYLATQEISVRVSIFYAFVLTRKMRCDIIEKTMD